MRAKQTIPRNGTKLLLLVNQSSPPFEQMDTDGVSLLRPIPLDRRRPPVYQAHQLCPLCPFFLLWRLGIHGPLSGRRGKLLHVVVLGIRSPIQL